MTIYTTHITFVVDSSQLGAGGTLGKPASIPAAARHGNSHPQMFVTQTPAGSLSSSDLLNGDTTVPVAAGEIVTICVSDYNRALPVRMAPCAVVVNTFNGASADDAMMDSAARRPIDIPNFDEDVALAPYLQVTGNDNPQWGTVPSAYGYWVGSPMIEVSLGASTASVYSPYVQFTASKVATGVMSYGIVFGVTRNGTDLGYFWFDPSLDIGGRS